jgi:hypothetical protein
LYGISHAFHDAKPGRHRPYGAQRQHWGRRYGTIWAGAKGHCRTRDVSLKIIVGFVQRLPDSVEVGFVSRVARYQRGRLRQRYHAHHRSCRDGG